MNRWQLSRLADVAEIRISNVDKKTVPGEFPVLLCNYMDVYSHDYIVSALPFMEATAGRIEIERFRVQNGDVLLTKDSETPDDIGIPAVVIEDIDRLVCGYHLALIKPRKDRINPTYLAKQLGSSGAARYFARLANGSTRYGLSSAAIANTEFLLPPLSLQDRIAEILSTVDEAIEQTEALIAKHQQIKAGLMHDLFTRGVTPDGRLRAPRSEAPQLYKQSALGWIPKDWDIVPLGAHIGRIDSGWSPNCLAEPAGFNEWGVLKTTAVVWEGYQPAENKKLPDDLQPITAFETRVGDMLITRKGPVDRVGVVVYVGATPRKLMFPDTVFRTRLLDDKRLLAPFLARVLGSNSIQRHWWQRKVGLADAQVNLNHGILRGTPILVPDKTEQEMICLKIADIEDFLESVESELNKSRDLKYALMQDLLTGRVRIKSPEAVLV